MSREDMLDMLDEFDQKLSDTQIFTGTEPADLAIGSGTGYEALLPKYAISTGRDGDAESISQARIYLAEASKWFKKQDFKIGDVDPNGKAYVGFLLSGVQENRSEKVQTTPLNGDNFMTTFYGESPTMYSFQGILYNTQYARWRELFTILYDKAFRGSQIAKHRQLLHIVYDNKIVSGWMLNLTQSISASTDTMATFNFQFLVRAEVILATETELAYNNAYFTGQAVSDSQLDTLSELPKYDDYLNVARIKPPPDRQRGSGKRGKRYGCRPSTTAVYKDGKKRALDPRFEGQHIRSGSPVKTNCDVASAAMGVLRDKQKAYKAADIKFNKSGKTQADIEARNSAKTRAKTKARGLLAATYKDLADTRKIKDDSARLRAKHLKNYLPTRAEALKEISEETLNKIDKAINSVDLKYGSVTTATP